MATRSLKTKLLEKIALQMAGDAARQLSRHVISPIVDAVKNKSTKKKKAVEDEEDDEDDDSDELDTEDNKNNGKKTSSKPKKGSGV